MGIASLRRCFHLSLEHVSGTTRNLENKASQFVVLTRMRQVTLCNTRRRNLRSILFTYLTKPVVRSVQGNVVVFRSIAATAVNV